jgi:hypothetical protein
MKHDLALFVDRLRLRLAQLDPVDIGVLNEKTVHTRADMLFEKGADFSETLDLWERGKVNETVVREAAVAVAAEACACWLATTYMGRQGDGR